MPSLPSFARLLLAASLPLLCSAPALAETNPPEPASSASAAPRLEERALDILQAMSERLSKARSLSFTAITTYEQPSRLGPPLAYLTREEVSLLRPNRLRVLKQGDGPQSSFYYNGTLMQAYAPAEQLLASMPAPASLDAALKLAYDRAGIYMPFTDLIVSDPYRDLREDMRLAFYIGQSRQVGGTTTDMLAYANDAVFVQAWIGADDHLPRMLRAVYRDDPAQLRHQVEFRDWKVNPPLKSVDFIAPNQPGIRQIEFAHPNPPAAAAAAHQPPAPASQP